MKRNKFKFFISVLLLNILFLQNISFAYSYYVMPSVGGASVGFGAGGNGKKSGSFGVNSGSSNRDSAWVNDMTEITGANVDIAVAGKTSITGAMIDGGDNLHLTTNELEFKDLHDFERVGETGFGVSTSVGVSTDKGETSLHPNGETSLTLKDTGHDREQITRATIGEGVIEVGGKVADDAELSGLNRDTTKAQEITKDITTGALDATASIDNRVFTSEGRSDILDTTVNILDNIKGAASNFANDVVDIYNNPLKIVRDLGDALNESINNFAKTLNINANNSDEYQDELIEKLKETEEQLKDKNLSEQQKIKLAEEIEQISSLVIQIETGTIECSKGNCTPKFDNINNYAVDENGNMFDPPVLCRANGTCAQLTKLENDQTRVWKKTEDLDLKIKLDSNGNPVIVKGAAYLSNFGKYDVVSIGSIHWSAADISKNGNVTGGGLSYLLDAAEKDFPEFYKEYITIAGTDNNGKANINNNSLISDSNKLEKLEKLAIKYENNEEFKKFENAVAYNVYYERPVSKLPQDIQNRINNLPIEAKQIIMSTYVQYGEGTNRIKQAFNAIDNDYMALSYIISKKDPYSSRKVIEFDILNKEYDIKN